MTTLEWAMLGAALLLLAEVFARLMLRRGRHFVWRPHTMLDLHTDRAALPDMPAVVRLRINSRGERSSEPPAGAHLSILVAGGSAPECYFLDQDQQWPALVQRSLNEPAALARLKALAVHVANLGRSFIDSAALERVIAQRIAEFPAPDIAVLMIGGNDIAFWMMEGAPKVRPPSTADPMQPFGQHPHQRFGVLPQHTALVECLRRWRRRRRASVIADAGQRLTRVRAQRAAALRWISTTPDPAGLIQVFERNMRKTVLRCRGQGVRVILAIQPCCAKEAWSAAEQAAFWGFADGDADSPRTKVYYDTRVVAELFHLLGDACRRLAAELKVECVNVEAALPADLRHYYDFAHVTPLGAQVLAQRVTQQILAPET